MITTKRTNCNIHYLDTDLSIRKIIVFPDLSLTQENVISFNLRKNCSIFTHSSGNKILQVKNKKTLNFNDLFTAVPFLLKTFFLFDD